MTQTITIYHNPKCGTSRNVLAMIRHAGIEPEVIEYLKTPPTRETLVQLIADMGIPVREVLRSNVPPYELLGLDRENLSDEALLDAMMAEPILINRPIVVSPLGTKLCRPSEIVLDLLPEDFPYPFTKEDGEVINQ
ncbi:arsenate reductase (glutaredoxin) [Streptococcus moroccensis]|uniref:arsenate reductase (glutathione/glutaredoxin) n=1 Tax=Streptococcus moroccensis TaxID=1451356 RepID=A0ABT9YW35_9STRE|nr:arsenate reductase (glutaredoxin) [Streptococcus moroccensis]MDQ0223533.1 arsenate reductase [Streptococcus moroccensis]